jgi:hypothetical protein
MTKDCIDGAGLTVALGGGRHRRNAFAAAAPMIRRAKRTAQAAHSLSPLCLETYDWGRAVPLRG